MKEFQTYFDDDDIIYYLCKIRAKYARQNDKKHRLHILTNNERYNYHVRKTEGNREYENKIKADLFKLLPPRRLWKHLGKSSRYQINNGIRNRQTILKRNIASIKKTILYFRENKPNEPFIIALNSFIKEIQNTISDINYNVEPPYIYPKPKHKPGNKITYRPICLFTLKDRLILSLTNKYFTELFDSYFDNSSLAFRAVREIGGTKSVVTHHDAINRILEYRKRFIDTPLWVAERDIENFYDSVNHNVILERFSHLVDRAKSENSNLNIDNPINIFRKYLSCYSFNKNVLPLNENNKYWESYNIESGEFGWIQNKILELGYYSDLHNEEIGVPQGGALSGLIANIVLDSVDKEIPIDPDLVYLRYCDDMLIIHPDKNECSMAIKKYEHALDQLKLVPHPLKDVNDLKRQRKISNKYFPDMTTSPFWREKSKGPYKWDKFNNNGFPWIGFVGYEISCNNEIRIRKDSLQKELDKQKKVIYEIKKAIKTGKRKSNGTIAKSAIQRLICMSVGRVDLWNYNDVHSEMCWKSGFRELTVNKYSIRQIKQLDRNRNKLFYKLLKDLKEDKIKIEEKYRPKMGNRELVTYDKPFSYYHQVIERAKSKI